MPGSARTRANGSIDTETALDLVFSNHRNALGGTNFWRRVVSENPVSFAESELIKAGVADEDIPDDLAADAGGAFTTHIGRVNRRYVQRCRSFVKIGERSLDRILKKATKDGENVAVNARFGRGGSSQGPTISTLGSRVLQFGIRPLIGGLTSSGLDNTFEQKIPLLGNLPLIGRLFKMGANENADTDLMVLVTPRLLPAKLRTRTSDNAMA